MSIYGRHYSTRQTPQSQPIPGKPMVPNSAGGFTFAVDKWTRLDRFLVLGAEGGSYYAGERELVIENCEAVRECLAEDAARTVAAIVDVSDRGRAPKNDPAVFALAMAAGMGYTAPAMDALPKVCRIGTHLFQFAEAVQKFRGWGRGLRKGIAAWYTAKDADALAYQVAKYQQRNGWSHRDLLRLAHPATDDPARDAVLRWAIGGMDALRARSVKRGKGDDAAAAEYGDVSAHLPRLLAAMDEAKAADRTRLARLIVEDGLPRECIPTEHLNAPEVWEALLVKMPLTAMVRNLGKMTEVGLVKPLSEAAKTVGSRLADAEHIRKSRLHPLAILLAAKTYAAGRGFKGSLTWTPVSQVNDALDAAFYLAFGNVEPANKRTLMGLDVSGSMGSPLSGTILTCAEGAAAMAMVQAKTESAYQLMAFDQRMRPLDISRYSRLADVVRNTSNINGGGTDCALPMVMALEHGWQVDTFQVYTDSETWVGRVHPVQALQAYRQQTGIPAKLVVVGMVSNGFTIADPSDAGMLDVVGFDASAPSVIADFSRGAA
jgi:60 kDa SS-A/Ro ribonucleoprotein